MFEGAHHAADAGGIARGALPRAPQLLDVQRAPAVPRELRGDGVADDAGADDDGILKRDPQ